MENSSEFGTTAGAIEKRAALNVAIRMGFWVAGI